MTNQLIPTVYVKTYKWHLKRLNLKLHLNHWFKWTSSKLNAKCISSNNITSTCHVHASYCCISLCFDLSTPFLLDRSCSGECSRVPVWGAVPPVDLPGKQTPLFIPIQSHSLAPALFYCIRTTANQLLLYAAVVEPIPLHDLSLPQ